MSEQNVSNLGFSKVQDTTYDSKLMDGLAKLGVLPFGFQCIQAVLDVSAVTVAGDGVTTAGEIGEGEAGRFIDVATGNPVTLAEGQQIVLLNAAVTTAFAAGANATLSIGLAVAGTSTANTQALTTATVFTGLTTDGVGLTNPGNVVGSALYLKGVAATETFTAGVIQATIVIV